MRGFVGSRFTSTSQQSAWQGDDWRTDCALADLPTRPSSLQAGENIMVRIIALKTPASTDRDDFGSLVFWTTVSAVDIAWDRIKSALVEGSLGNAVAVVARMHKPDWYIQEFKRPFGQCRLMVYLPHVNDRSSQAQAASFLAALLSNIDISHIFYVSNADIAQMKPTPCVPQAARLTQPVYHSSSHELVYVGPELGHLAAGTQLSNASSSNASSSTAKFGKTQQCNSNSSGSWLSSPSQRYNHPNSSWGRSQGDVQQQHRPSRADADRW